MIPQSLPLLALLAATSASASSTQDWNILRRDSGSSTNMTDGSCSLDQTQAPQNLTVCGNATLFTASEAKLISSRPGWMNDPMGIFQRDDGSLHLGYQCHPRHIQWGGGISQCSAFTSDFTTFQDADGLEGSSKTLKPSEVYDIRGVFDGSIVKQGYNGLPSIIYTSTFTTPLGATAGEEPGAETQSLAYTSDGGASWTKLDYGAGGNPIIYDWPAGLNLTGFRDPYLFQSPYISKLLENVTSSDPTAPSGSNFMTISGGIKGEGSLLMLYRQQMEGDLIDWTFLGKFFRTGYRASWSEYSGNFGFNFETAAVARLNSGGRATDDGSDESAVNVLLYGTEQGRNGSHENHWPLWSAVDYSLSSNGSVESTILYSGVLDWGRTYAFVSFPYNETEKVVMAGWTYEDDENLVLAKQMGYQGAFVLFRDLFIKEIKGVVKSDDLFQQASWSAKNESDGTVTITTLGQRIVPETLAAFKQNSQVSYQASAFISDGYKPLDQQPTGRHYKICGTFEFSANSTGAVGFRVLASDSEYTDILYNPETEELTIDRTNSSLIDSFGKDGELGKLKLFQLAAHPSTRTLELEVIVDNSIIEVHANEETIITTRVYPWLDASVGAGLLGVNGTESSVSAYNVELWDGLVDAWPSRADNSSRGLVWDGPTAALYGLWSGI